MDIIIRFRLTKQEVQQMPFAAFYEYWCTHSKYGVQQRAMKFYFTPDELKLLPQYANKGYKIFSGASKRYMEIDPDEYKLWCKIGTFLSLYYCK